MKKGTKLMALLMTLIMTVTILPLGVFADEPWEGDASKQDDGWYLLKSPQISVGPYVSMGSMAAGKDLSNGYTVSVKLDISNLVENQEAAWSFTIKDKSSDKYLNEAQFHFRNNKGQHQFVRNEYQLDGNAKPTEDVIVNGDNDNIFNISAKIYPDTDNSLKIQFLVNGQETADVDTNQLYSVAAPGAGWLFYCTASEGVYATVPTLDAPAISNPNPPVYDDDDDDDDDYEEEEYTLTFDVNGGDKIKPVTRDSGSTINLTRDRYIPTREGYTFDGWYSNAKLTKEVKEVTLYSDKTVYAKWVKNAPETGKENPAMGADDFVGVAVALAVVSVAGAVALSKKH